MLSGAQNDIYFKDQHFITDWGCLSQEGAPTHGLCHVGYQAIVAAPKMAACKTSEWIMSILGSRGSTQAAAQKNAILLENLHQYVKRGCV